MDDDMDPVMYNKDAITREHIEASEIYIRKLISDKNHKKDAVCQVEEPGDVCTAEMLGDIIQKRTISGAVSVATHFLLKFSFLV